MKNIEFSKVIPIVSIFVWGVALFKLSIYYFYFGIEVIQYLELAEIFTLFLNHLFFLVLYLIFIASIFWKGWDSLNSSDNNSSITGDSTKTTIKKSKFEVWSLRNMIILFIILLILLFTLAFIAYGKNAYFFIGAFSIFILGAIALTYFSKAYYKTYNESLNRNLRIIYLLIVIGFCIILSFIPIEIQTREDYAYNHRTIISLDNNETIKTTSDFFVVGNTKNYLFLHHNKRNNNTIIPTSRIQRIDNFKYSPIIKKIKYYSVVKGDTVFPKIEYQKMHVYGKDTLDGWVPEKSIL